MFTKLINQCKKYKYIRSFKLRIFLILFISVICVCSLLRNVFMSSYLDRSINVKTQEITTQVKIVANHLITSGFLKDDSNGVLNAELSQLSNLYDGRVLVIDSDFTIIYDTYHLSVGKTMIAREVMECFKGSTITNYDGENGYIEVAIPIVDNSSVAGSDSTTKTENMNVGGVILTSASTSSILMNYEFFTRQFWIIEILVVLFTICLAFVLTRILCKPFEEIAKSVNAVATLEEEIEPVSTYIETEEIVEAFQKLRNRMKILDESRQEFVSNVSHELRTPITSMKVLADSLIVQEDAPIEMYKEFMIDIAGEIDRESKIISDLLDLVRMDQKSTGLNITQVDINELMELLLKRLGPIARKSEVDLILESRRPVVAYVDEVKLTLALSNLIENGIKYNKHPGWVRIILDADHQNMTINIIDCGIGIPQESIDHIYERFYRVDKSHSREIGGTGLGLAITRKILLLHKGSIDVESMVDEGTTFTLRIPLNHIREVM